MEDFDPRPPKYRGTATEHLPALLEKVRAQGLCVSLLLDPNVRHWDNSVMATPPLTTPSLPGQSGLADTIAVFKESLKLPEEKIEKSSYTLGTKGNLTSGLKFVAIVLHHHCSVRF